MRRDKARLRLGTRTLLAHVRALAEAAGPPVRVVRLDLVPRCGPLGGVCTALATSSADTVLFLSCDMPFLTLNTLRKLMTRSDRESEAVFLEDRGTVGFPFLVRRNVLSTIRRRLANRKLSLQGLARALKSNRLRLRASRAWELLNINTPEDLKRARQFWRERHSRRRGELSRTALSGADSAGKIRRC